MAYPTKSCAYAGTIDVPIYLPPWHGRITDIADFYDWTPCVGDLPAYVTNCAVGDDLSISGFGSISFSAGQVIRDTIGSASGDSWSRPVVYDGLGYGIFGNMQIPSRPDLPPDAYLYSLWRKIVAGNAGISAIANYNASNHSGALFGPSFFSSLWEYHDGTGYYFDPTPNVYNGMPYYALWPRGQMQPGDFFQSPSGYSVCPTVNKAEYYSKNISGSYVLDAAYSGVVIADNMTGKPYFIYCTFAAEPSPDPGSSDKICAFSDGFVWEVSPLNYKSVGPGYVEITKYNGGSFHDQITGQMGHFDYRVFQAQNVTYAKIVLNGGPYTPNIGAAKDVCSKGFLYQDIDTNQYLLVAVDGSKWWLFNLYPGSVYSNSLSWAWYNGSNAQPPGRLRFDRYGIAYFFAPSAPTPGVGIGFASILQLIRPRIKINHLDVMRLPCIPCDPFSLGLR